MPVHPGEARSGKSGCVVVGAPCPVYPGYHYVVFSGMGFFERADVLEVRFPDVRYVGHVPYPPQAVLALRARERGVRSEVA